MIIARAALIAGGLTLAARSSCVCLAAGSDLSLSPDPISMSAAPAAIESYALALLPSAPAPIAESTGLRSRPAAQPVLLLPLTPADAPSPAITRVLYADAVPATAPTPTPAESGEGGEATELAKKLSNPVANLISVPFQYNADFGAGTTSHAHRSYLNIQPVIPFELNSEWNLITRTILPVIYQEQLVPGQSTNFGLGDTTASFFFSPKAPADGWIWGVGPVAFLPTATDTALGTGKWGTGITGVALRQEHGWTYGILANHIWSVCGDDDRPEVNNTFLQPFLSYTFPTATSITLNTESTYDWHTSQWTVPINLMAAQLVKIDKLPVQFQLGGRYYAEGPTGAPDWGLRFAIIFLFPK